MEEARRARKRRDRTGLKIFFGILLCLVVVLAITAGILYYFCFYVNEFYLDIRLNGEETVTLEYGEGYSDPGAQVYLVATALFPEGRDVTELLVTENAVDAEVLGKYRVGYSAHYQSRFLDLTASASREVTVVDTRFPVITLVSDPEKFTIPGESYAEEGYKAEDNYDGDLTDRVRVSESAGVVTYTVADTAGNVTTVQRQIRYHDPIAPTLVLTGESKITLIEGASFKDPGCTANDNCDGNITDRIQVTGKVDTGKLGTYTLTYAVADSYNNTATVTRTVIVQPKPEEKPEEEKPDEKPDEDKPEEPTEPGEDEFVPPVDVPSGTKVIYLTFDDGPGKHTARLLDILDKYGVKATFFVVGTGKTSMYSDIVNRGHAIGIHCYSHKYSEVYASDEAYLKDLETMHQLILDKTGVDTRLLRFPGGSSNTASRKYCKGLMTRMTKKVEEMGYRYFDWNVDSKDAGGAKTASKVFQNVVNGCSKRNVSVVLQHDTHGYSVDAVEKIIQWGLENGYTFAALDVSSPGAHHSVQN